MKTKLILLAGLLSAGLLTSSAQVVLTNQHVDVGVAFEDGAWDLHIHDETNDIEYEPDAAVLLVGSVARTTVPNDPAYSFLGRAGRPIWILPQVENEALLFLGIGSEEIPDGLFLNNAFDLTLKKVRGPGHFTVWDVDAFGTPSVIMNTRDRIRTNDVFHGVAGSHAHVNWGFSQPGRYRVAFEATATLADGTPVSSGEVTYTFRVQRAPRPHAPRPNRDEL